MKAALLDIIRFSIILLGVILFMEADALNTYPESFMLQQQGSRNGDSSFLREAEAGPRQFALLRNPDTEHKVQEEMRSFERLSGNVSDGKGFHTVSRIFVKEKLEKNSASLFCNEVPIYLKVCSFRL